jgi:hypothetical protein
MNLVTFSLFFKIIKDKKSLKWDSKEDVIRYLNDFIM